MSTDLVCVCGAVWSIADDGTQTLEHGGDMAARALLIRAEMAAAPTYTAQELAELQDLEVEWRDGREPRTIDQGAKISRMHALRDKVFAPGAVIRDESEDA